MMSILYILQRLLGMSVSAQFSHSIIEDVVPKGELVRRARCYGGSKFLPLHEMAFVDSRSVEGFLCARLIHVVSA